MQGGCGTGVPSRRHWLISFACQTLLHPATGKWRLQCMSCSMLEPSVVQIFEDRDVPKTWSRLRHSLWFCFSTLHPWNLINNACRVIFTLTLGWNASQLVWLQLCARLDLSSSSSSDYNLLFVVFVCLLLLLLLFCRVKQKTRRLFSVDSE